MDREGILVKTDGFVKRNIIHDTKWIELGTNKDGTHNIQCPNCGVARKVRGHARSWNNFHKNKYCGYCGQYMWEE